MNSEALPITGRCMCGAVQIEVAAPFLGALYCHCKRCQRRSGTAFSMTALCAPGTFAITRGADTIRTWDPGDGWKKVFCTQCGSHTHTIHPTDPTTVAVRMGCLDADPGIRPQVHQYVTYASPLIPLQADGLPRFPERLGTDLPAPCGHPTPRA